MASLWPWLAVAGVGALHGLNPAAGWAFAAVLGVGSSERSRVLQALLPIALGHAVSVALVAAAVLFAPSMDRIALQWAAGAMLVAVVAHHLRHGRKAGRTRMPPGRAGLALWSFMMSTAHGAGLMLVPALIPLCMSEAPAAREITASGSLALALAAVGVHMAAMLAVTGAVAVGASRGFDIAIALLQRRSPGVRKPRDRARIPSIDARPERRR
ncbi:hypothetical protein QMO14_12025 [Variovorax sp. CAN2819]|uniref:hypothetical protein n=1 Tax=Variovorax sp. CAN15 TaxID=3046727 RepID=UPI0026482126|nr:hypothetical protein [Variovorax sp. CAN15]MDN6884324.1 hypothetical protein [Variovorax sp. CAN15]